MAPNLPPESDARIIELTNMTPSDLRSALGRIGSEESAEIAAFFATSQMKDIVFGADLMEDERTQARTLMYVFGHTFAIPGVVKTLRGIEFSLKSTVGEPIQTPLRREGKLREVFRTHLGRCWRRRSSDDQTVRGRDLLDT